MERNLDKRIDNRFLDDFLTFGIPQSGKLLSRDDLSTITIMIYCQKKNKLEDMADSNVEEMLRPLVNEVQLVWATEGIGLQDVTRTTIPLKHGLIYHVAEI